MDSDKAGVPSQWLSPSEALQRFHPPEGSSPALGMRQTAMDISRFGFRIGQLRLLIQAGTLSEVITQTPIYPMPNVPSWFVGVMNLRGNLIPVFDLHHLLEAGEPGQTQTILVLDQGRDGVGIPIDGLPHAIHLGDTLHNVPPLPETLQEHVATAYTTDGGIWLDFDHQSFFTALGWQLAS
ncbi:chemotaxis protein CheW [Candidatus Entotheonella palauensis]|uniref:chemotaxis protein CheW n=1 Tax=Candidatus Entotheonella palauensis TaxID=93172 RepID=UPI000B7F0272|nr:chemotaxis protein CheW [Candidatus Entotheonella palauensis]